MKIIYYCASRGSTNVEAKAWLHLNETSVPNFSATEDESDCWCNNCESHTDIENMYEEEGQLIPAY